MKKTLLVLFLMVFGVFAGCKKKEKAHPKAPVARSRVVKQHKKSRIRPKKKRLVKPKPAHKRVNKRTVAPKPVNRVVRHKPTSRPVTTKSIKKLVPDVRLLLTVADVEDLGLKAGQYERLSLPGKMPGPEYDSLYYKPNKKGFGIAIQVWAFRNYSQAKAKYRNLFAGLPNARSIDSVSGDTLFAYWGDIIYIAFVHPRQRVVVNLSCSKKLCTSNKLYEIAKRVSNHLNTLGR